MSDALYPAMRWHPQTGEAMVITSVQEDDPSYLNHHPADEAKAGPVKADEKTKQKLTKAEIVALLAGGQIEHDPKAKVDDLRVLLADGLKAAMQARGISYETDADLETLYATMMAAA